MRKNSLRRHRLVGGVDQVRHLVATLVAPSRAKPAEAYTPSTMTPAFPAASPEQVVAAVEAVKRVVAPVAQNLQFSIDDTTGKTVIHVMDANTKELIRQIPSEELMVIARALDRLQGLLLHKKA